MLQFIPPAFFDLLIIVVTIIGLVLAALRIRADFRKGSRFPDGLGMPITPTLKPAGARVEGNRSKAKRK